MKTLLEKSISILGWQGGTIHQVLETVKAMGEKDKNRFISQLRDFAASSNETDIFYNFVENYLKPIHDSEVEESYYRGVSDGVFKVKNNLA